MIAARRYFRTADALRCYFARRNWYLRQQLAGRSKRNGPWFARVSTSAIAQRAISVVNRRQRANVTERISVRNVRTLGETENVKTADYLVPRVPKSHDERWREIRVMCQELDSSNFKRSIKHRDVAGDKTSDRTTHVVDCFFLLFPVEGYSSLGGGARGEYASVDEGSRSRPRR